MDIPARAEADRSHRISPCQEGLLSAVDHLDLDHLLRHLLAVQGAWLLDRHPASVTRMIKRGELRATKIVGRYLIPTPDVLALLPDAVS